MSHINISNIIADSNPTSFLSPFQFTITFECLQPIKEEIEWKVIYVGSPKDSTFDQELDSFTVGPFSEPSVMQFNIEPPAPNWSQIPTDDILGVAAIIHSVSYQKQEFFRVGYFVYNNYEDPFLCDNPYPIQIDKIFKSVLADKPRIIRHNIDWESQTSEKMKALNDIIMENSGVINNDNTIQFKGLFSDLGSQGEQNCFGGFGGFNWNNNMSFNNNSNNNQNFDMGKENYNENKQQMGLFGDSNKQFNSGCFMNQENGGNFNNMNQPNFFNQQNGGQGFVLSEQNGRGQQFGNGFFNMQ